MKTILFQRREEWNKEDKKIYESSIMELDNLSNKQVFLLKDDKTSFEIYGNARNEDIKSVYIIVKSDDFNIKIKGNISYRWSEGQIQFWPIFVSKYGSIEEHKEYLYEIKIPNEKSNISRFEQQDKIEELYKKIIREFKLDKYTPPIASTEWKDFMEPYDYYVDLKFELLKQDFMMITNFDQNIKKIIYLKNNEKQYNNFLEKENFIMKYEDNRRKGLIIDYNEYHKLFDKDYLKNNTYFIAKKTEEFTKENKNKAENDAMTLNSKLRRNENNSSFFSTKRIYNENDLKGDGRFSKDDIELETEFAFVDDLKEEYSVIDMRNQKIINLINTLNGINIPKLIEENNIDFFEKEYLKIAKIKRDLELLTNNIKKEISMKYNHIIDEDIEYINDVISAIENLHIDDSQDNEALLINIKDEFSENIKLIKEEGSLKIENVTEKYNNKEKKINENIKLLESEQKQSAADKKKNKNDKIIRKISSFKTQIDKLRKEKINKIDLLTKEKNNSIIKYCETFKNGKDLIKNINLEIKTLSSDLNDLMNAVKESIARTVIYIQELIIIFNYKNSDYNNKLLKNIYMVNTGDMVLVDTIKRINRKIKIGQEINNEILYKIIRKTKMNKFVNKDVGEKEKFIPIDFKNLNPSQKQAFMLSIDEDDPISIIQGPPGTGKTEVITSIIKYYRNKGDKVILSSQTNVAIKNVLDKLCSQEKVNNSIIIPWLTTKSKEGYSLKNINEVWYKKVIENISDSKMDIIKKWKSKLNDLSADKNILINISLPRETKAVAATTTTSITLPGRGYDSYVNEAKVLIIDEVSKSILPEILRYALDVEKVILVGDAKQLNPIFDIDPKKIESNIDKEKFTKLKKEIQSGIFYNLSLDAQKVNRMATLNENYRSVPGVINAYNIFYSGKNGEGLKVNRKFSEFSENYNFKNSNYFDTDHSLYMFDVKGTKEEKRGTSRYNKGEIKQIINALHDLSTSLIDANEKDIAVIFPYAAQINIFTNELRKKENSKLRDKFRNFEYDTVDSFQGSEADIVLLSTVITDPSTNNFLQDFRRINVSMSRAKDMLIIFGNALILKQLEISGDGIANDKYFNQILDTSSNDYLKIIKITDNKGE